MEPAAHVEHAAAEVHAEDESPLDHVGEDRHALGLLEHRGRQGLGGVREELIERLTGGDDRLDLLLAGAGRLRGGRGCRRENGQRGDENWRYLPGAGARGVHANPFAVESGGAGAAEADDR
jgi:hypothetical protein